jgi:hypothetical protein
MRLFQRLESFCRFLSFWSILGLEPRSLVGLLGIEAEVVPDAVEAGALSRCNPSRDKSAEL